MKLLDVNVVLAAFRDDHPLFAVARPWLEELTRSTERFGVPLAIWGSFMRLATHRRIFPVPAAPGDAFAFARAVRAQPGHVPAEPGPRHLELFEQLCNTGEASGDLTADAQLAAIALERGCTLISFDRDFSRFDELRWERPAV